MSDQADIPPATIAAGAQADPDWWLEAAKWHEAIADRYLSFGEECNKEAAYVAAAALACRTFALMMRRAAMAPEELTLTRWEVWPEDGTATWEYDGLAGGRSLPAAAVAALTEGE